MSEDYSQALKNIVEQLKPTLDKFEEVQKTLVSSITKFDFSSPANELLASLTAEVNKQQQLIKSMGYFPADITKELSSISATLAQQPISAITEFSKALKMYGLSSIYDDMPELSDCVSDEDIDEMIKSGDITQEDIASELHSQLNGVDNPVANSKSEKVKKAIQSIIKKLLIGILLLAISPITDTVKDKIIDTFRVDSFWRNTGIIEWIDDLFDNRDSAVSEEEAKASVDLPDSTNISKEKREDLIRKISEIRSYIAKAKQDENTAQLMAYLSDIEKDVNGKKYGLVFEEHREAIDEVLDNYTPVLTEDKDLYINNGGNINFLIEGDNLASLKLLEKTHKGKIDLIFIDPPYNTLSSGFTYSDNLINNNDEYRHSKWSSFIKRRLEIAKNLLSATGCIFISIDDNEFASLKLLCDDVFGWQNFITSCMWQKIHSIKNDAKYISVNHDYIFVYAKNIDQLSINLLERTDEMNKRYKNPDNDPNGPWQSGDLVANETRINGNYDVVGPTGKIFNVPEGKHWVYSQENMNKLISENQIWFGKNGTSFPRKKRYLSDVQQGRKPDSIWLSSEVGHNQEGARELKAIFNGENRFTNPKPTRLIERIIKMGTKSDSIVLDFFAGSGTTGHAVMKLNAEVGDNRRFILCTNNENNICRDVTYERIKRVIEKEDYKASLKYYQVQYIPIEEKMYYEYADSLLLHIRELVELENGINFNGNAEIAIVLTDEELGEFIGGIDENNKCKKLYMGHDLLPDEEQDKIIKDHDIEICIIPDYYYRDLQER